MQILTKPAILKLIREHPEPFDAAGSANPFACSQWQLHFVEEVAGDDWAFVVPQHEGEGLMLLYSEPRSPDRCRALTNYYASLFSPLIGPAANPDAAIGALVDQLALRRPRYTAIDLAPLDAEAAETRALHHAFARHGWYVKRYFCFGNWYLPCAGLSFRKYMETRESRLLNTWTRKSRRFATGPGAHGDARLEIVSATGDVDRAIAAFERVYAKSWKPPEPYPSFVPGWARICARNGWLRLGLAWLGDVPIAAQLWFTMNRRAYIFKLAYDEAYATWSAGTVLTAHLVRHSLEQDRVVEIDYLTGDDAYKRSWMTQRRERIGLIACNPRTPRGLMLAAWEWAGALRHRLRGPGRASPRPQAGPARPGQPG